MCGDRSCRFERHLEGWPRGQSLDQVCATLLGSAAGALNMSWKCRMGPVAALGTVTRIGDRDETCSDIFGGNLGLGDSLRAGADDLSAQPGRDSRRHAI